MQSNANLARDDWQTSQIGAVHPPLPDGWHKTQRLPKKPVALRTRNQALDFLRQYQKELLIKELINGYNTLQGLFLKKNNQQKNLNFYERKVQEAEILFQANRITKTDLLDFQNELISAESLLLDYDRQIDNLMLQVNKLLDMELEDEDVDFKRVIEIPDQLVEKKLFS